MQGVRPVGRDKDTGQTARSMCLSGPAGHIRGASWLDTLVEAGGRWHCSDRGRGMFGFASSVTGIGVGFGRLPGRGLGPDGERARREIGSQVAHGARVRCDSVCRAPKPVPGTDRSGTRADGGESERSQERVVARGWTGKRARCRERPSVVSGSGKVQLRGLNGVEGRRRRPGPGLISG